MKRLLKKVLRGYARAVEVGLLVGVFVVLPAIWIMLAIEDPVAGVVVTVSVVMVMLYCIAKTVGGGDNLMED